MLSVALETGIVSSLERVTSETQTVNLGGVDAALIDFQDASTPHF